MTKISKKEKKKTIPIFICLFGFICLASLSLQPCYVVRIAFLSAAFTGQESSNDNEFAFVAGGRRAPEGRFLYMCSIRRRGNRDHACGGLLIASKWVLTAAHCLDPSVALSTGRSPLIYCGIHHRQQRDETKTYGVTRCYLHHMWTGSVFDGNDIALCELDRVSSSPIPDLVTAGDAAKRFDRFTVLGWGVSANSSQYAEVLQMGSGLRFVPDSICNDVKDWQNRNTNSMICAGFNDPNTCRGDSGGPLLVPDQYQDSVVLGDSSRDLIVGITSFGDPSCDELVPGVYTREERKRIVVFTDLAESLLLDVLTFLGVQASMRQLQFKQDGVLPPKTPDTSMVQSIRLAIENDDSTAVEGILCEGLNPNATFGFLEDTLLKLAARQDSLQSAEVLIRYGAGLEYAPGLFRRTPLHIAAESSSVRVTELLIKSGANIDSQDSTFDRTPLIRAVVAKKLNTVQVLIQSGADLDIRDSLRYAALHHAAKHNVPEIAKVKSKIEVSGKTIQALIDAGADLENAIPFRPFTSPLLSNFSFGPSSFVFVLATSVDDDDDGGWTSLHVTARYDSSDVTKVLLDSGAKIEGKTDRGSSALHIAAMSGADDVAKILIVRGADINSEDRSEWTPLHFAAQNNSLTIAKDLEAAGAKKETRSRNGYDPLMVASYHGSLSVVEFLLDESVTANSANNYGDTPLHLAASRGHASVVDVLLQNRASKLTTNNRGETPFDEICSRLSESECSRQTNRTLQGLLRID